jgi:hypothetical protein
MIRLIRLLKLLRLLKLTKILGSLASEIDINPAILKMYALLATMAFMAHLLCCVWFFIGFVPEEKHLPLNERTSTWFTSFFKEEKAQLGTGSKYIASMYWTIATMTAVGYGDIVATTDTERVFSILAQVIGAALFGFIIGNTNSILETVDLNQTYLNQKHSEVKAYMIDRKFPKDLQTRVKSYYAYYLSRKTIFDEELILDEVSSTLRADVVKEASRDMMSKFVAFTGEDTGFTTAVFTKLKVGNIYPTASCS